MASLLFLITGASLINQQYLLSCYERDYVKTSKVIGAYPSFSDYFMGETITCPALVKEILEAAVSGKPLRDQTYKLDPSVRHCIPSSTEGLALYLSKREDRPTWDIEVIGSKAEVDAYIQRHIYGLRRHRWRFTLPLFLFAAYYLITEK